MDILQSLVNSLPGVAGQGLIWGLMAMGVYITYRILDVADLTVDGTLGTGGAVCVLLMVNGVNAWLALLIATIAGMLAGLVTGLFHTKCGIPAILSGILTQLALYSINLRIMGWGTSAGTQSTLAISVDKYDLIVSSRYVREPNLSNPLPILLVITAAVIALLWWFFKTESGSALRATGANRQMARAQGINTSRNTVIGLMISNGMVGLAGGLLAQYQGSSSVDMGRGAIVIGLAAVIIGEVLLRGNGKVLRGLIGCTVGAIVYYFVIQIVLRLGLGTNDLKLFTALIVALFLAIPYWKGKAAAARKRTVTLKEEKNNARA
ncbi:MAG TPA: ABC transporter permease [Candidatus Scatomorpha gallistercoris]|nr:ABC transporter permease [Candidatus Scatomorpha gallistercoris]